MIPQSQFVVRGVEGSNQQVICPDRCAQLSNGGSNPLGADRVGGRIGLPPTSPANGWNAVLFDVEDLMKAFQTRVRSLAAR